MNHLLHRRLLLTALALAPFAPRVSAQDVPAPTEEVPYVQTPPRVVRRMLQMAEVTAKDLLWDLGFGRRAHRDRGGNAVRRARRGLRD